MHFSLSISEESIHKTRNRMIVWYIHGAPVVTFFIHSPYLPQIIRTLNLSVSSFLAFLSLPLFRFLDAGIYCIMLMCIIAMLFVVYV